MGRKIPPLLQKIKYFGKTEEITDHSSITPHSREAEKYYRNRWQHDKIVRTTHGVNCTGSCSWKVHVKDGIITWETQQTDYPTTGADIPEYEPRGCPRGASFSWYIYSPHRIRYPYIRRTLLELWKEEYQKTNDPVEAWKNISENPEKAACYKRARGKGGFVRIDWNTAETMIAAQLIYTLREYGPDRIFGFSPIPAMSMVSYAGGARFLNLLGAPLLSFYDWYADLPPASPQVWGEQTDVPESSDWYNSGYLLIWGSNLPQTRTPDAHFMVEARYRGTKVVAISPDYAEFVKFADNWLTVNPGMDGALAMAMTHVILKEFYVDKRTEYFEDYVKKYTDLPFLITLKKSGDGYATGRFLRASDLDMPVTNGEWKTIVFDEKTKNYAAPNGSIGHRWENRQEWNLHLKDEANQFENIRPALSLLGCEDSTVLVKFPYFGPDNDKKILHRAVPVKKITKNNKELFVTTVFDLLLAQTGVNRGLSGDYPQDYNDKAPFTPAWQEEITGVDRKLAAQIAREFAQNAIDSKGRSMIIMGSGINHWFHSDAIYRTILNLVLLTGCEGVNGGGWAHYVGQEKVRPLEGFQTVAMARDWGGPPRLQNGTSFFYFATGQWRFDEINMEELASPLVEKPRYSHPADYNSLAVKLGWLPSYPQFDRNPLKLHEEAGAGTTEETIQYITEALKKEELQFAIQNPEKKENFPRTMFVWRANLIGSSSKGHEYFLKYLLGTHGHTLGAGPEKLAVSEIENSDDVPEGKLDLLINIDFRMQGTGLYSDIVLPAATWYEKYDISSTDMHPFIHPFNPAIATPWESRSDWDTFKKLAKRFSEMAKNYFPTPVKDVVTEPLLHDSPAELSQSFGKIPDWTKGTTELKPGENFPKIHIVERDYTKVYDKYIALGPKIKDIIGTKGISWETGKEYQHLMNILGPAKESKEYRDYPNLSQARNAAEAILTLSSTTNGALAVKAWESMEAVTGLKLKDLASERAEEHMSFDEITAQPRKVITSPVYSGTETGNRRYSPFTTNVDRLIPWRTLTGRQHFYLDHELMLEFGEELPIFKAPLRKAAFYSKDKRPDVKGKELTLRYLTPHYKWSYHSTYWDTQPMLTLFRGGPHVWLNREDAESAGIDDNDWVEIYNRNGVVIARAVVTHRLPRGIIFMYHVQERHINVPGSTITKQRGGTFNSPTRIHVKPTQMIGGYAQLSYGFNYYGPTGNQRDEQVLIRKVDKSEVDWLED